MRTCGPTPPPSPEARLLLVITFDEKDTGKAIDSAFTDPTVRVLLRMRLAGALDLRRPSLDDIVEKIVFGRTIYTILTPYHVELFRSLQNIAQMFHCAGNDHNQFLDGMPPPSLPKAALQEISLTMRGISLFNSHALPSGRELDNRGFATQTEAVEYLERGDEAMLAWYTIC